MKLQVTHQQKIEFDVDQETASKLFAAQSASNSRDIARWYQQALRSGEFEFQETSNTITVWRVRGTK